MKQLKNRTESAKMKSSTFKPYQPQIPMTINSLEAAKAAFPIFGGTGPVTTDGPEGGAATTTTTGTGTTTTTEQKPEAMTPEQISELLAKVTDLTSQVTSLKTENDSHKAEKEKEERAKLGREEALGKDLDAAQQTIQQMDTVIQNLAIVNAIQNNTAGENGAKLDFYDAVQVVRELDPKGFELVVDLQNGEATVKNINSELARIAKEKYWMVKTNAVEQTQQQRTTTPPRQTGTGTPPANPPKNNDKATRRSELESKWPIIAHGRAKMPSLKR